MAADEDAMSVAPSSGAGLGTGPLASFPVSLTLSKSCCCCLCNCKSTDPSPLQAADEDDCYSGARPWNKYRKVRDAETDTVYRVPEGKICLLCFGTFRILGLDYKYNSYGAYFQVIRDNAQEHTKFLQACREFIRQKNENPNARVDKEAVKKAATTLHSEHKTGIKLKGPEREFVMLEHWDTKLDGEIDESKVVEQMWQGEMVKGIWRNVGRAGVLRAEQYEDTNMSERTEEHSGQGPFAKEGLATKKEALQKVFTEAEDERKRNSVAAGPVAPSAEGVLASLRELLPQLNTDIPTSEPGGTPSLEPEAAAAEEDASDQEEEEALGPAERLARTFGGPKQKAAGKAKAKATAPKPSAKAKSSFPVSATAKPLASAPARPAALQPKPAVANTAQAAIAGAGETLQLDGRVKRLKENLREILEKVETQLEEHLSVTFSLAQADAKQVYPKKTKAMNALLNSVSKQRKKIEDSVNKAGLLEELERYLQVQDTLHSLLELYARLNTANPACQELSDAVAACGSAPRTIRLGPEVWQKLLETKCAHFCLYQDFVGYCQLFRSNQEEAWAVPTIYTCFLPVWKKYRSIG